MYKIFICRRIVRFEIQTSSQFQTRDIPRVNESIVLLLQLKVLISAITGVFVIRNVLATNNSCSCLQAINCI